MDNTNRKKIVIQGEMALLLRGLIIGKILTLVVIGGLFWWLVRPRLLITNSIDSLPSQSTNTISSSSPKLAFETGADIPIGSFKYGGSTAWAPIRQLIDSQIQNAHPELQLNYVRPTNGSPGSGSGIRMLLNGQLDFAQSSRPVTVEELNTAKQRGFTLEQRQVGIDGIAVVVNPSLTVPGLTVDQLQQIYHGEITNWKQVDGPDLPITPFAQHPEDADTLIFSTNKSSGTSTNKDLNNQGFSSNVQYVHSTTQALRQLNKIPGGLYYASARTLVPQCSVRSLPLGQTPTSLIPPYRQPKVPNEECIRKRNQLNTQAIKNGSYPLTTNLFVIIKHNNGPEERAGEAYAKLLLTEQGQKAIEQAGFVRVP
ncbi:phosphate ABC transporter substrate-binding protein [Brasilonema octagenarum UFV-E1]|uniref:Phosphate ABC transporter substrate-binding protein n=1 Tax=Brasilonema sennae CENA114 TaxID=415709 RepID=A0A856M9K2_9CYAN|nr:PstS family phosphate ABC transporter substrate-binding protein [Brasilonema sennae]QDL06689.1 phosphate ABC transporter substrate-binding protein [Brasilonema sennae CENA114]QDL13057.1 phosphate ABC transporter substrate-binding protein [Brasilonema octagenarum UFV-E1]